MGSIETPAFYATSAQSTPAPLSDAELDAPRPIKSYARWITKRSAARAPSAIRALQPYLSIPGMVCGWTCEHD